MATKDLKIKVDAETTQAQSKIKSLSSNISGMASATSKSAVSWKAYAAAGAAAAVAIKAVINAASQLVTAYKAQEQAESKLQSTLTATGNSIGMYASDLTGLARSLQSVTTYSDETIMGIEQVMVATKNISKEALPQATELSLDLAAAMGTSATEAAKKMAKALADPASGLEGLKDANIYFTDSEKDMVLQLSQSGKTLEAQQLILDKVAASYGGVARSVADTDTGKLDQIKNTWSDIKQGLGEGLVNALGPAFDWLLKQLDKVSKWISDANAEREMGNDLSADWQGGVAGAKYSPETIKKWQAEYASQKEDAASALLSLGPWKKSGVMPTTEEEVYSAFRPKGMSGMSNEDLIEADTSGQLFAALAALGAYQKAAAYEESAGRALAVAIEKQAADAAASAAELEAAKSAGSSGTASGTDGSGGKTETVKTLNDYIEENTSLSKTAQAASIDASIAEAQKWKSSILFLGEDKKMVDEIIESLKRQKAKITGVKEADMALGDYQEQLADGFKGMDAAAVDAMVSELETSRALSDTTVAQKENIGYAIDALGKYKAGLSDTAGDLSEVQKFLQQNGSMSETYTSQQTASQLEYAESLRETAEEGSDVAKMLDEIIAKLKGVSEESKTSMQKVDEFFGTYASSATSLLSAGFGLADQLMQNEVDAMQSELDAMTDKWDKYLSDLEDKYDAQTEALSMSYALGRISAEDYYSAIQDLQDEKSDAEQQAADEKEALQQRINAMEEKQFNADKANSIAQATISGAQAVVGFLANPGGVPGAVLSVMAGITAAAQIATIASKQYTPALAEGGVVTRPTTALIGEAGPEMVLPLSKAEGMGFGGNGISLTIQTGDVYTKDDLSRQIYEGIQKAQRTGLLPGWKY